MDKVERMSEISWSVFGNDEFMLMRAIGVRWISAFRSHVGDARREGETAVRRRATDDHGRALEADPTLVAIDVGIVHYWRGLNLRGFLHAPDDAFFGEMLQIQRHINRPACRFPLGVLLQFDAPPLAGRVRPVPAKGLQS